MSRTPAKPKAKKVARSKAKPVSFPDGMLPANFRSKPITAMRYTGDNAADVQAWAGDALWLRNAGDLEIHQNKALAQPGDWVVRNPDGEFVVVASGVFEANYEVA